MILKITCSLPVDTGSFAFASGFETAIVAFLLDINSTECHIRGERFRIS